MCEAGGLQPVLCAGKMCEAGGLQPVLCADNMCEAGGLQPVLCAGKMCEAGGLQPVVRSVEGLDSGVSLRIVLISWTGFKRTGKYALYYWLRISTKPSAPLS